MFDQRPAAARTSALFARHGDLLGRVARQYSLCADDAQDAVQRALEIYMRRADSLDPSTELAWLKVVVKHEALAVRKARAGVASEDVDLDAVPAVAQLSIEERLESAERVSRSAEVMRRLKRDEARALMLKAEGLSYVEIGERLGWTYTNIKCPLGPSARSLQSAALRSRVRAPAGGVGREGARSAPDTPGSTPGVRAVLLDHRSSESGARRSAGITRGCRVKGLATRVRSEVGGGLAPGRR
jgi:RNA polymerase sigma factor (sigma-70 family)